MGVKELRKYTHLLKIFCTPELHREITRILGLQPDEPPEGARSWFYSTTKLDRPQADFINEFMDLLEPKLEALRQIGITPQDIAVFMLYEYEPDYFDMCNMEFVASDLARLGNAGIDLCISCWVSDECYESEDSEDDSEEGERGRRPDDRAVEFRFERVRRVEEANNSPEE